MQGFYPPFSAYLDLLTHSLLLPIPFFLSPDLSALPFLSFPLVPSLPPSLVNWLSPTLTLRQQGLLEHTLLLTLRKKLFFTDENVNSNDPVQLHLLYVQVGGASS